MRGEFVTITASLLIRESHGEATGYMVPTSGGGSQHIASLSLYVADLSDGWREDFRTLCKHMVEDHLGAQHIRVHWVMPQAHAARAG